MILHQNKKEGSFIRFHKRHFLVAFIVMVVSTVFVTGLVLFFVNLYPPGLSRAATVVWTGETGDGLWQTAGNWSGSAVPTASDDVTIASTSTLITVTLSSGQTANFSTLTIGGETLLTNFILEGNIGTGGSITIDNSGVLEQKNAVTQTISGTLTIKGGATGGKLTHTGNASSQSYILNFVAQAIDVQAGGVIDITGKGYGDANSGPGPGIGQSNEGVIESGGGAHGGNGGTYNFSQGGIGYCLVTDITTMGSPGGQAGGETFNDPRHGAGGGLALLRSIATTTLNGSIIASGAAGTTLADNTYSGGGGGGGLRITAGGAIAGTPTAVTANGGAGFGEGSAAGGGGCIQLSYHTTNSITALGDMVTVDGGAQFVGANPTAGLFYAAQTNAVPTTTVTSVVQSTTSTVTFVASVTDVDLDVTSLVVEHSLDGANWSSSTLGSVTPSQGSVSTSTGRISGIATDTATTTLTAVWNIGIDAPTTTTSTAYMRFVPTDGALTGAVATSTVFSIVTVPPSDLNITSVTDHEANFTWSTQDVFTSYALQDVANAVSSGWVTGDSHQITDLTCGVAYTFAIKGKSSADVETGLSASIATTTLNCGPAFSASGGGGGGGASDSGSSAPAPSPSTDAPQQLVTVPLFLQPPVTPEVLLNVPLTPVPQDRLLQPLTVLPPPTTPLVPDTVVLPPPLPPQEVQLILNQQEQIAQIITQSAQVIAPVLQVTTPVTVGAATHSVTVSAASASSITFVLRSNPITLTLQAGEQREADTDGDSVTDVLVSYKGLLEGKPLLALAPLINQDEAVGPFTINTGALQTKSTDVLLTFGVKDIRSIEISNTPDFVSSVHFVAASSTRWRLPTEAGVATVYARIYKNNDTVVGVSDSIFVRPEALPNWSAVIPKPVATSTVPVQKAKPVPVVFKTPLRAGSVGNEVRMLQVILKAQGLFPVQQAVTGYFGQFTYQGVVALQKKNSLTPIGQVGPQTRALLNVLSAE